MPEAFGNSAFQEKQDRPKTDGMIVNKIRDTVKDINHKEWRFGMYLMKREIIKKQEKKKRMLTEGVMEVEKNKSKKRSSLTFMPRKWSPRAMTGLFTQRHKSCG